MKHQAERFRSLGARQVAAVGDLKAAAAALPFDRCRAVAAARLRSGRVRFGSPPARMPARRRSPRAFIAIVAANHPGLLTIIVPRHPARGDAIGAMLAAQGLRVARRARGEPVTRDTDVYLADTMGELGLFYRLAEIAFIGGSLAAKGGHNPFEAARLDCAVLHGPDMSNCAGDGGRAGSRRAPPKP